MKITSVDIVPVKFSKILGLASVTLDGSLTLYEIRIVDSDNGPFISFPANPLKSEQQFLYYVVEDKELKKSIEESVLSEYQKAIAE